MIASFHVIEYRRPVVSPPKRLTDQVAGLRFWRPLNIGGDFGWFHDHPSRWGLYARLRPDFRRWAFYAVWDTASALEEFLTTSETGRAWSDTAAESCHLWLRPTGARGRWEGTSVLENADGAVPEGPVAHLVRLDLSLRGALAMWGSAAPSLLHRLPGSDELLLGLPMVDRPYVQPVSFSLWRSAESATTFAYRNEGHRDAVARVRRSQKNLLESYSTARFEPYRCDGTWKGSNPLAAALPDRAGPVRAYGLSS